MHVMKQLGTTRHPDESSMAWRLTEDFLPLTNQGVSASNAVDEDILTDAEEIMVAAIGMDKSIRMSRAQYTLIFSTSGSFQQPPMFGFTFDSNFMEYKSDFAGTSPLNENNEPLVDLVVSPGLLKLGDTDGRNYQSHKVLAMMGVVCNTRNFLGHLIQERVPETPPLTSEDQWQEATVVDAGGVVVSAKLVERQEEDEPLSLLPLYGEELDEWYDARESIQSDCSV